MTKTVHKMARAGRIQQSIIDEIRPKMPPPEPSWLQMMAALDDLERAGGIGAVYPDSRVHAGTVHLDHTVEAFFQAFVYGYLDAKFGRKIIITDFGRRAVIKHRWGKLPDPTPRKSSVPEPVEDDETSGFRW